MPKDDVIYYKSPTTKMIHMVGVLPEPLHEGKSQCGNMDVSELTPMPRREVLRAEDYQFCRKCAQLLGRA